MISNNFAAYGVLCDIANSLNYYWQLFDELDKVDETTLLGSARIKHVCEYNSARTCYYSCNDHLLLNAHHLPGLATDILHSAKAGLRCAHITAATLQNPKMGNDFAHWLRKLNISDITIEGGFDTFDEILEHFIKNGWQIEGIHYLPEQYADKYHTKTRSIYLTRPVFGKQTEDWKD